MVPIRQLHRLVAAGSVLALTACAYLPRSGPTYEQTIRTEPLNTHGIRVVTVDTALTARMAAQKRTESFAETLGNSKPAEPRIGLGDTVEVSIWEAPPATLFTTSLLDPRGAGTGRNAALPAQVVSANGSLRIPFAGMVPAAGRSTAEVEDEIVGRLARKANQPQAMVRIVQNTSSVATVIGEVNQSLRLPLTASGERLLDAIAAAGGVRQPVNKITVKLTRGPLSPAMALEKVIRDPAQNVALRAGDVVTVLHRPYAFSAMGATGRNEEIEFEAQGITLAQALARSGGLADNRADSRGVFVFRFEDPALLTQAHTTRTPPTTTPASARVPVVYRVDLQTPSGFFVAQSFEIQARDVIYVANAPATELQKFLNLLLPLVNPTAAIVNASR